MGRVIFSKRFRPPRGFRGGLKKVGGGSRANSFPQSRTEVRGGAAQAPPPLSPRDPLAPAWVRFLTFLKLLDVRPKIFLIPLSTTFLSMLFEAATMALLIPLIQTLVERSGNVPERISLLNFVSLPIPQYAQISRTKYMVFLGCLAFAASLGKVVSEYLSITSLSMEIQSLLTRLRTRLFERYLKFGKTYFDRTSSGKPWAILMNYTYEIASSLPHCRSFLSSGLYMAAYLVTMVCISWKLTLVAVLVLPVLHFSIKKVHAWVGGAATQQADNLNQLSQRVADTLACLPLIKAVSMQSEEMGRFNSIVSTAGKLEVGIQKRMNGIGMIQEILTLAMILFLVQVASFIGGRDSIGPGSQYLVFFLVVRRMGASFSALTSVRVTITRMGGILNEILEVLDDRDKHFEQSGTRKLQKLQNAIEVRDLSFSYGGNVVLKGVSFQIKRGEVTAIVGASGSGKTTIMNLLQRYYECPEGSIFIDGVDIREFEIDSLRAQIAVVSQDTYLFTDTLRNNLIYGLRRAPTDEQIQEVLKKATLFSFVETLPKKIDTMIGERGVRLSGGEKQRLVIARAMMRESEILLLDEATSSLDTTTERQIQSAIDKLVKNRTAVVIAHRLSTIMAADRVIVLDQGKLVEQGTVRALLKKRGKFYEFYKAQNFGHEEKAA